MPSYTEEQKRKVVEMVDECGGSVTRAMRKLGYSSRQTLHQWLNERDASYERKVGRPWSHYDPALKAQAVAFVRSGMAGEDVAEMLGVSSAAVACNRARAEENPSRAAAERSPVVPMRDSEDRAFDGFEGDLKERVRQLELENDISRAAARVLRAASPGSMTNREKTPVANELGATTGRSLREPTDSLRISKGSYGHRRDAPAKPDRYPGLRARVRGALGEAGAGDPLGPRLPLPLARMDRDLREERPGQVDVEEGMRSRQLGHGGLFRKAEERVLLPSGLVGRVGAGVLQDARCVFQVLQRGETEGKAGVDELDAIS